MHRHRRTRWALGALAAILAFVMFTVAGWAGDPQFDPPSASLAPDPVTGGGDVLYNVTFPYTGQQTLTRSEIRITFPADWDYAAPADPDVCNQSNPTTLICVRGTIRSGDPPVTQAVRFTTGEVDVETPRIVSSVFTFFEQASQGDKGRADSVSADAKVQVVPVSNDNVSKCAAKNGESVETPGAVTEADPMKITLAIPANAAALCSPVSALELPPGDPAVDACPGDIVCTTETAVVSAPLFTPANPIKLTLDVFVKVKTWYKNGQLPALADCTGPPGTADPDPCISGRPKGQGQVWTFLWSGDDPSYGGA